MLNEFVASLDLLAALFTMLYLAWLLGNSHQPRHERSALATGGNLYEKRSLMYQEVLSRRKRSHMQD